MLDTPNRSSASVTKSAFMSSSSPSASGSDAAPTPPADDRKVGAAAATIHDVARIVGVSVTTVSHALSGKRAVAESTRSRIIEATTQLGYRPNSAATALRTGSSLALALIVPDIANPFFADLARGVEDAAQQRGYSVFLCNTALQADRERRYISRCLAGGVDGIVYCSTQTSTADVRQLRAVTAKRMPIVVCDERIDGIAGGVFSDNRSGGRIAAEHLLERGCRRPVVIGGPNDLPTSRERVAGFIERIESAGLDIATPSVVWTDYTLDCGELAIARLLREQPTLDAVFAADDLLAIGAIRALRTAGRSTPDDVLVCGFDDVILASLVSPSVTSIRQQIDRLGSTAANLLLDAVIDDAPLREIVLPVSLVERESTAR